MHLIFKVSHTFKKCIHIYHIYFIWTALERMGSSSSSSNFMIERAKTKLTPSQTLTAYEPQAHLTALVPIDNHGLRLFN